MLTLLIALMLASIALLAGMDVWALQRQRQQEEALLFVGNQYRQAIERYYLAGRSLPMSIDDLIDDKRFPVPLHHLRRAYADPLTGRNDWELLRDGTGIYGIHSRSDGVPIQRANFSARYAFFANAQTYADWQFIYPVPGMGRRSVGGAPGLPPKLTTKPGRPVR
ncbi:type II secretion system protein [Ralstonia solanacearum]|uniref:type II secretion system protein n=1 Tax=Ralstonia solanacearum TaxID=305 RepID=UPI001E387D5C|nr:type II secretion system protein [Ralstonia solanacearum]